MASGLSWSAALRTRYSRLAGIPVEYDLRRYQRQRARVDAVGARDMSDSQLKSRFAAARRQAAAGTPLDDLLSEVFALTSEACARALGMRPFDVQMMAAIALHQGKLAQLATGEGKTLVAVMPAVLNALAGRGVHVLTANDYLARRDAAWMGAAYRFLGLTVAAVTEHLDRAGRQAAYAADITYVTAKEAGLRLPPRSHRHRRPQHVVQRPFHYAIVDEADFILIDEARVPLVIAGETAAQPIPYQRHRRGGEGAWSPASTTASTSTNGTSRSRMPGSATRNRRSDAARFTPRPST